MISYKTLINKFKRVFNKPHYHRTNDNYLKVEIKILQMIAFNNKFKM